MHYRIRGTQEPLGMTGRYAPRDLTERVNQFSDALHRKTGILVVCFLEKHNLHWNDIPLNNIAVPYMSY